MPHTRFSLQRCAKHVRCVASLALAAWTAASAACTPTGSAPSDAGPDRPAHESAADVALTQAVQNAETDADFVLILGTRDDGVVFTAQNAAVGPDTLLRSASTSKLVTSVVLLSALDDAGLSLQSKPQDVLAGWSTRAGDVRAAITMEDLLAFTSGLHPARGDEGCVNRPGTDALPASMDLAKCVAAIHAAAEGSTTHGSYVYGAHHMQVAGLMVMRGLAAQGLPGARFSDVFDAFKARTGLFGAPGEAYDLPSARNPRLAGGMHWTGASYAAFLHALLRGELLSGEAEAALRADHTPQPAVPIVYSPAAAAGHDWHYGLGAWLECDADTWKDACGTRGRLSSPGAYGAYPFVDFERGTFGILAREGALGTYTEGLALYTTLKPRIDAVFAAHGVVAE